MADETILIDIEYSTDDAVKDVNNLTDSIVELQNEQKALKNSLKEGTITQEQYSQKVAENTEKLSKEKKERKDSIKLIQAEKNSRDGIKASINKLKQARDKLDTTNKKDIKRIKELNKQIDKQNKRLGKTKSSTEGLSGAITTAIPGLSGFSNGMKIFGSVSKVALGPLGLLLLAFAALKRFFTSSEEGQNRLNKIMTVGGVIINNIADIFGDFGRLVLDSITVLAARFQKFFANIGLGWQKLKGVFTDNTEAIEAQQQKIADAEAKITERQEERSKSLDKLTTIVKGLAEETRKELKIAEDLADRQAALDVATRENLVREAELRRDIALLRAKAADKENVDAVTRLRLLDEAIAKENELLNNSQKLAKERLALKEIENSLAESTKEDLEEQARLEAELIALETTNADKRRRLISERLIAEREIKAEDRAIELEEEKLLAEELAEIDRELEEESKRSIEELEQLELDSIQRKIEAEKEAAKEKESINRQLRDTLFEIASIGANTIFNLQRNSLQRETQEKLKNENLTEKEKLKIKKKAAREEKQIAIKQAIINGALSVVRALFDPGGVAGALYAVVVAAATAAEVATIQSQSFGKGGRVPIARRGAKFGTFSGPSHSGGGIDLFTGSGQHVANVEGKENFYVVNKDASDYINTLSSINQGIGGGIPLSRKSGHMQAGGQADIDTAPPSDIDINDLTERVIKNLPPIITRVESIKTGIEEFDEVIDVGVV